MLGQESLIQKFARKLEDLAKLHQSQTPNLHQAFINTNPDYSSSKRLDNQSGSKPCMSEIETIACRQPFAPQKIGKQDNEIAQQKTIISQFISKNGFQKIPPSSKFFQLISSQNYLEKQQRCFFSAAEIKKKQEQESKKPTGLLAIKPKPPADDTQNKEVYTFIINNLIELFSKVPGQILKCYIKQQSMKYSIAYENIIVSFGIEQTIKKFFEMQDLACQLNQNYILSVLDYMIPDFLCQLKISDWNVIKKIGIGLCNRYLIKQRYSDKWLLNSIRRKAKVLNEAGVNLQHIYLLYKNPTTTHYNEEPSYETIKKLEYSTLHTFIKRKVKNLGSISLDNQNEQKALNSSKQGIETNLRYYLRLKQEMMQRETQKQMRKKEKQRKSNQIIDGEFEELEFEIVFTKVTIPQGIKIFDFQDTTDSYSGIQVKEKKIQVEDKQKRQKFTSKQIFNQQKKEFLVRKTIPILQKNENPVVKETNKKKTNEDDSIKPDVLRKMCMLIYNFRNCYPNCSLMNLERYIEKILIEDLKVPNSAQKKYKEIWCNFELASKKY